MVEAPRNGVRALREPLFHPIKEWMECLHRLIGGTSSFGWSGWYFHLL